MAPIFENVLTVQNDLSFFLKSGFISDLAPNLKKMFQYLKPT